MQERGEAGMKTVLAALSTVRMVSLEMDIWTKKGYSSYLGISVAFCHPILSKPLHLLLNLYTVSHPHTGAMIARKLAESMATWQINQRKLLCIITDNGRNMVKAVKSLH